ncbi:glutamate--tRNA ligase [Coralloluteibacterium stylophorae]|uniref:Glutamate--tRNA ligase n=1 Tax=Coralloluteibacterium stylophorae TaxID=1776034 RepID=A0A8J7VVE9_9GAMM|nr:glutamate--tRNA ligase [Coralloluteibacterium stylophorae]MBS7456528.1 glutamate--tRNA ligase [Coralloluteibacterium stylophorae]
MTCRTRFAPSPTGFLHIGGARTALYCWLQARHSGGEFVLRIEDTDRERSTDAAVQAILDGMRWLGLDADEGPIYQTQRFDRYREVAEQLVAAGKAYYAYETREELDAMRAAAMEAGTKPRYNGHYRDLGAPLRDDPNRVIRFRNPQGGSVVFEDKVKGRIEWANAELDDLVLIRSDGFPTYNFAVVVDDLDMRITDVIRGDDHVNNTPRQINIYEALGAAVPAFSHLPMILGPDGAKLSKRHGAVGVMQYRADGFLPQALLNYLVRLGWSHGDQEIFSREEMVRLFDIADVNHSASRFDLDKLSWLNQHYFKASDPAEVAPELEWHLREQGIDPATGPAPADVVVALADRVKTLKDMAERAAVWYRPLADYDDKAVAKHLGASARAPLEAMQRRLEALPAADWSPAAIDAAVSATGVELELGLGKIAQPLRVAMTGTQVSPSIDHTVYLAGRDEALRRIAAALARVPAAD